MRRFNFNLARLLSIRRYREREWELKLAAITGSCLLIRQNLKTKQDQIDRAVKDRARPAGMLDIDTLFSFELFIARLDQEIVTLDEELERKEEERRKIQERYLVVSRERKVLEKLKERREEEYFKEQKREEFKVLDDVNNGLRSRRDSQYESG